MRKILMPLLASIALSAADIGSNEYSTAMSYLNGERGVTMETRIMPNCPYERCADIVNKDGTHTFSFAKKDYNSALKHLALSANKGNIDASKQIIVLLKGRLNWKEQKPDGYLIAKLKEDLGIDYSRYKELFLQSVSRLKRAKTCDGYMIDAEIKESALFGTKYDLNAAADTYLLASKICAPDSYNGLMAQQKYKSISTSLKDN